MARLRTYLTEEDDVINVLQYHQQILVNLIYSQMQQHFVESAEAYEAQVTKGYARFGQTTIRQPPMKTFATSA